MRKLVLLACGATMMVFGGCSKPPATSAVAQLPAASPATCTGKVLAQYHGEAWAEMDYRCKQLMTIANPVYKLTPGKTNPKTGLAE